MRLTLFGGVSDTPLWAPEDGEQMVALMGGINLDWSHVQLPESLRLSALAIMGGIKLIVPRGTDVVLKGFELMGGRKFRRRAEWQPEDIRSVIYLNAVAVMGGIEVIEAES